MFSTQNVGWLAQTRRGLFWLAVRERVCGFFAERNADLQIRSALPAAQGGYDVPFQFHSREEFDSLPGERYSKLISRSLDARLGAGGVGS